MAATYLLAEDVIEAMDAIDEYAARDLDHELHSIVDHYRRALGVHRGPSPEPGASEATVIRARNEEAVRLLHALRDLCGDGSSMGDQINKWLEQLRDA